MTKLDRIIGYKAIKNELIRVCDMVHNKEIYENLGAKLPRGILLYGESGFGKTFMAECLINEVGLEAYTVRCGKGTDDFIRKITETFSKAKENAPSVVFLDDIDKLASENRYIAVQSGFDEIHNFDVLVLATANDTDKLPDYLNDYFDKRIEIYRPTEKDACEIIEYYLKSKKISDDVNIEDATMMISYNSCKELETLLNEAAISAAFARRDSISMDDLKNAVLHIQHDSSDGFTEISEEELRKIALHEAGHLVVSEVLCPQSVGLASVRPRNHNKPHGFIRRCKDIKNSEYYILVSLAGKAATELYYSGKCADGCRLDINWAFSEIRTAISESGTCGLGMIDVATARFPDISENLNSRNEAVVHAELERYMFKTRDILLKNREFLEKATELLLEKETLLYSDIKALRESVDIVEVEV